MFNHNYIGTEHVLLGLLHEGEGVACVALTALGVSLEAVRKTVEDIIGVGTEAPTGHIPFTPRAKKILEFSLREALQLGHNYIGTEHILLGIIREGEGVAAQVLKGHGIELTRVRQQVIYVLSGGKGSVADYKPPPVSYITGVRVEQTQVGGGGGGAASAARLYSPEQSSGWVDVTSPSGNRIALNLNQVVAMEELAGFTEVYFGTNRQFSVKETIAQIWGEDAD